MSIGAFIQTVVDMVAMGVAMSGNWLAALSATIDSILALFAARLLGVA